MNTDNRITPDFLDVQVDPDFLARNGVARCQTNKTYPNQPQTLR